MRLFDSHCHLQDPAFDPDREACLQRMAEAGVQGALLMGTNIETSRRALSLAGRFPALWAAVGVHPGWCAEWTDAAGAQLAALLARPRAVAVGEIGLDARPGQPPMADQLRVCEAQLRLAAEAGKPVCLHVVHAHPQMLRLLKTWAPALPGGVCHGFTGSFDLAREYLRLGLYISLGSVLTDPRARRAADCARRIPLGRLLLETDSPFRPPAGRPGSRGEPRDLLTTAAKLAELREISLDELGEAIGQNTLKVFGECDGGGD